ncbi:hypothetical protein [Sporosarcina sp. ITBMC105]
MKKNILFVFLFLILGIAVIGGATYFINNGKFEKNSHVTLPKEHFETGDAMYVGYEFSWKGSGYPTLQQVEFIRKDGKSLTQEDAFLIVAFIDETTDGNVIGSADEETVNESGLKERLVPINNYKLTSDTFRMVLQVHYDGDRSTDAISDMKITYKKFGVTKTETIPFEGVLHEQE